MLALAASTSAALANAELYQRVAMEKERSSRSSRTSPTASSPSTGRIRGGRGSHRRQARRGVPARRLADRQRHADQHEHERGARQSRDRAARRRARREARRAPERRREPGQSSNDVFPTAMHVAAVQAIDEQLLPARARAARHAGGEGGGVRRHRQDRPHAPAGRDAADARPGDLGLGGAARPRRSRICAQRCRTCASSRSAAPRSAPGSTRTRSSATASRRELARAHRPAVRHRAEQVRGARRARRAGARARRAQDARRVADEDRQRRALARVGPALRPRRDHASPRTSRAARSCRAR